MANQVTTTVAVVMQSDGSSTTFSFDLLKDHYFVINGQASGDAGTPINWFTADPKLPAPTSVSSVSQSVGGATYTSSLSGTVVTVTLSAALAAGGWGLLVYPIF